MRESDYGYYGITKTYEEHTLPITQVCGCGKRGTLITKYDDIPGYRDTTYLLECKECGVKAFGGDQIEDTIKIWDNKCEHLESVKKALSCDELQDIYDIIREMTNDLFLLYFTDMHDAKDIKGFNKRVKKYKTVTDYFNYTEANLKDKIDLLLADAVRGQFKSDLTQHNKE